MYWHQTELMRNFSRILVWMHMKWTKMYCVMNFLYFLGRIPVRWETYATGIVCVNYMGKFWYKIVVKSEVWKLIEQVCLQSFSLHVKKQELYLCVYTVWHNYWWYRICLLHRGSTTCFGLFLWPSSGRYWINFLKQLYLIYMGVCEVFGVWDLACCVGVVVWVHENCMF